jgi:hypothetical protein
MKWRCGGLVVLGWALVFGNKEQGFRESDVFDTKRACADGLEERAREVRDRSHTKPPMADVRKLYQCVELPTPAPAAP